MNPRSLLPKRSAAGWLLGLLMLFVGLNAAAQQDPPGRVGRINFQQGTVSVSPAGDDNWYQADPNRPLIAGDRVWTDRNSRAEIYVGSTAVRLDEQTAITLSELDDQTLRITATQGDVQMRVRDELAGQRIEIGTANLATVIDRPGDLRIDTDPGAGTTLVAVAAGSVMLFGENGESIQLDAHQQLTVSGRNLAEDTGAPPRGSSDFDRWVAERDRLDDQSTSARYVSRDVLGYQQLDAYGDWQSDPTYGQVWYPRNVDAGWAPYQYGQWVEIAPWGWTWIDAAPWGFAPMHYGRWARIGPRWGWVPGRPHTRPVYAPALVGFVGGGIAGANLAISGGRQGIGWFPLAPGEAWRPGYRASQRYVDAANRAALGPRLPPANVAFANRQLPGATTIVPMDAFGRAPVGRRDAVQIPHDRLVNVPVGMGAPIPLHGGSDHAPSGRFGFGRPAAPPPAAIQAAQQHQLQQALQIQQTQQVQRQQTEMQQRATAQAMQAQTQQMQQAQRQQFEAQQRAGAQAEAQQRAAAQALQAQRQQQEAQQRAAAQAMQGQQAQQVQQAQRAQAEAQERAAAQAMQAQRQQQAAQQRAAVQAQQTQQVQQAQRAQAETQERAAAQAMQAQRQQQEAQQRAAAQAQQAQQLQQAQRQQQEAQRAAAQAMQAQQAQQMQLRRQQMEAQQRAAAQAMQAQRQQQETQQLQRQQMEMQQRAAQAQAQQMQQLQQQQQQQAAMRAQQQQQAQQQQAMRQAQEARQRGAGRPGQDQPDRP
ncbi:DUF6600 domain-containing protein [Variovorax sp. YR216]|uniref:DUF6600 domain-containing protein n=1 Tax=Variovorax sp. YR216 TaxID=1882828 RepID=UPI000895AFE1|nr:DUF6600 domain-containing protein [Variovorax sp. YR216]SEA73070.1 FecR family protein [Variovorax sp. YR216]